METQTPFDRKGTPIGRVRGLGSAHRGPHHWLLQRFTGAGNLLLALYLVFSVLLLPDLSYDSAFRWLSQPAGALPMALLIVSVFWHARLGLQVMIEDYVHDDALRVLSIVLLNFYAIGGAALGVFSIARIAFGGAPA